MGHQQPLKVIRFLDQERVFVSVRPFVDDPPAWNNSAITMARVDEVIQRLDLEWFADSGLFAQLIGRNSVKLVVPLHWNHLLAIGIHTVVSAFANQPKSICFKQTYNVFALDRHYAVSTEMGSNSECSTGGLAPRSLYASTIC